MTLVIYHDHCADGFCSAWLIWREYRDAEFFAASYGQEPPNCAGKDVMIVDFSYPREVLERIKAEARSLIVLDHHKTAEEALKGLPYCTFDMNKSGAMLTWEYLYSEADDCPWLVEYVQDRDLWKWELPWSREINAAVRSYPYDFEVWDGLSEKCSAAYVDEGRAILRAERQIVDAKVSQSHQVVLKKPETFYEGGWWHIWQVANATTLTSETAGALAEKGGEYGVGCVWFELPSGERVYSLRSRNKLVDVSKIAKHYGGGGHCNAAGFKSFQHPWKVK